MLIYKQSDLLAFSSFISRMAQQENYEKQLKKDNFKQLQVIKEAVLEARQKVPALILQDLNYFVKEYKLDHWLDLVSTLTESTVERWLENFESEGHEAFLSSYQQKMFSIEGDCTDLKVKKFLEDVKNRTIDDNRPQYRAYLEFSKEVETVFTRWTECLKVLYPLVKPYIELLSEVIKTHELELLNVLQDQDTFYKQIPFLESVLNEVRSEDLEVFMIPFFEYNLMLRVGKKPHQLYMGLLSYTLCKQDNESERDAEMLRTIADPTKLTILERLSQNAECGKDLSKALGLSKATISHHMSKLGYYGLIDVTLRDGKIMYYETKQDVIKGLFERLNKRFEKMDQ